MANELTDAGSTLALNLLAGGAQTITTPLKVRLMTVAGSDTAAGTEVTGGSYVAQTITLGTPTGDSPPTQTHAADIVFTGMPACTIVGFEIWDSSATPKRLWGPIARTGGSQTVSAGAEVKIPAGGIVLSID